jgi:hypothetical protein
MKKKLHFMWKIVLALLCFLGLFFSFFILFVFIIGSTAFGLIAIPSGLAGLLGFRWVVSPVSPPALLCFGVAGIFLSIAVFVFVYRVVPNAIAWCRWYWDRVFLEQE